MAARVPVKTLKKQIKVLLVTGIIEQTAFAYIVKYVRKST